MFPKQRKRRLRNSNSIRKIVSENHLTVNDLVSPIFLTEGKKVKEEIESMPGYFRLSLDFFIPHRKIAIEVQGSQHDEFNSFFE